MRRRLRSGELLALAGAIAWIVVSFLPWYRTASGDTLGAWDVFGVLVALMIPAVLLALALAAVTVTERSPGLPVFLGVWTTVFGLIAVFAAIGRVVHDPMAGVSLRPGVWIALAACAAIFAGAWQSMRDERTTAYPPPEIAERPLPPV